MWQWSRECETRDPLSQPRCPEATVNVPSSPAHRSTTAPGSPAAVLLPGHQEYIYTWQKVMDKTPLSTSKCLEKPGLLSGQNKLTQPPLPVNARMWNLINCPDRPTKLWWALYIHILLIILFTDTGTHTKYCTATVLVRRNPGLIKFILSCTTVFFSNGIQD